MKCPKCGKGGCFHSICTLLYEEVPDTKVDETIIPDSIKEVLIKHIGYMPNDDEKKWKECGYIGIPQEFKQ